MHLQPGDWVRSESGEIGRVVHTARLSVFVRIEEGPQAEHVQAFLLSQLTRIEPPQKPNGPTLPSYV
jgi:hypothetical protein